jgi:hypothetical protein
VGDYLKEFKKRGDYYEKDTCSGINDVHNTGSVWMRRWRRRKQQPTTYGFNANT